MASETDDMKEFTSLVGRGSNGARRVPRAVPGEEKEGKKDKATGRFVQYAGNAGGYFPTTETIPFLPSGCYAIRVVNDIATFMPQHIVTDRLLRLPDSKSDMVIQEIGKFWGLKDKFKDFGFSHKRGYLLFGPPGSGKTATIAWIVNDMVKGGGLVFLGDSAPGAISTMLTRLREIEPERQAVVVLEDIDAIVDRYGESELLSLLDGEGQIDNVVFIASTNYPERLDPRIINRPSRFDRVVKIGMPNEASRRVYLADRLGEDFKDLDKWARETKDLSLAHIKEIIVSVFCLENPFADALDRVRTMKEIPTSEDDTRKLIGLKPSRNGSEEAVALR